MKNLIFILLFLPGLVVGQEADLTGYGVDTSFAVPKGLEVGTAAPNFSVNDVNGNLLVLDELQKEGPVVLLFYRGKWCPVCSKYLNNFNDSIQLLTDRGARVIAVGPEKEEYSQKMKKKTKSDFSFVADTSLQILLSYDVLFNVTKKYRNMIKTYLLTDIAENNGKETAMIPVPATYVINKEGTIVYKQFDYDYKNRASVKSILEHL
ncbi:MAG: AhpC/TSA family protein [Flavobacteriales bacterium]|nr:AhpC/TSA family protein [Flavobacteriales bacterium]